jgi:hypothetical protein
MEAAKRRKNAAHGVSHGDKCWLVQAPEGRKKSYDADAGTPCDTNCNSSSDGSAPISAAYR